MNNKKKYFLTLLVVILFLASACATEEKPTASVSALDLVEAAVAGYSADDIPDSLLFVYGMAEDSDRYLDPYAAGLYFKGVYGADMSELDNLTDYAIHLPNTKRVFEIDVMAAETPEGLLAAKALLGERLAVKNNGDIQNYTPEEVPLLDAAEIFTIGNYAFLLSTPDNSIARGIIDDMLKTDASGEIYGDNNSDTEFAGIPNAAGDIYEFASFTEANFFDSADTIAPPVENIQRSAIPDITVVMHNETHRVLIGGSCVPDAVIHMRGGVKDLSYNNDDGNFLGNIEIPESGSAVIYVTTEQPGLAESLPYKISVKVRGDVNLIDRMGAYHHIIGADYQGFVVDELNDRTGANIFTDTQIESVKKRVAERVSYLAGINCELIYLIIPTPMHVYPELVPDRFPLNTGITRTEQFETAVTESGAVVINLYELFTEHKNDEFKIFHKTDTHWTQYGAYLGYLELLSYVSEKWPDATPRGEGEVEFYKEQVEIADLAEHTEMDQKLLRENATFMRLLFDTNHDPNIWHPRTNRLNHDLCSHDHVTKSSRAGSLLPRAYIMRDSFGTPIYALLSDAFESANWKSMWRYDFDKNDISRFKPDYLIYIVTERNIGSIL